ncbi:MAG: hypothetical protein ACP5US_09375 [Candidatus Kryptoniota bacterium]
MLAEDVRGVSGAGIRLKSIIINFRIAVRIVLGFMFMATGVFKMWDIYSHHGFVPGTGSFSCIVGVQYEA